MLTAPDNPYQSPKFSPREKVVRSKCFTGIVLGGWRDEFIFFVPPATDLRATIENFYVSKGARRAGTAEPMVFSRGNLLWSLLGFAHERLLSHSIRVLVDDEDSLARVTLHYRVFISCGLRIPPNQLLDEAELLATRLRAVADPAQAQTSRVKP